MMLTGLGPSPAKGYMEDFRQCMQGTVEGSRHPFPMTIKLSRLEEAVDAIRRGLRRNRQRTVMDVCFVTAR